MLGNHGNIEKMTEVLDMDDIEEKSRTSITVSSQLEITCKLKLKIPDCYSMCVSSDSTCSIWIGGNGYVYKMFPDCYTIIHQIPARKSLWPCLHIACLQSGDDVVSYGGLSSYIDRFTSDGRRVEFTDLSPRFPYDIAVNDHDEVVVNVDGKSLIIISNSGEQLREIKGIGDIQSFCIDRKGNFIVAHPDTYNISVLDGDTGKVIATWSAPTSDIKRVTSYGYGNILATNREKSRHVFSENGKVVKIFTMDCDAIIEICVNHQDPLLILVKEDKKYKILVAKYFGN